MSFRFKKEKNERFWKQNWNIVGDTFNGWFFFLWRHTTGPFFVSFSFESMTFHIQFSILCEMMVKMSTKFKGEIFHYLSFFFECIGQITVCVWEIRLQFNGTSICIDGQINKSLLIVNTCQITMYNRIIWW